jgi:hypothetical protein
MKNRTLCRTLQSPYAQGPLVILVGVGVSYERGTPVQGDPTWPPITVAVESPPSDAALVSFSNLPPLLTRRIAFASFFVILKPRVQ